VLGVTNLRGDIVSVVDCGAFLHLHEKSAVEMSSMCVVRNQRRSLVTSLIVDRIEGMLNLSGDIIALPENALEDRVVPYLQGVYEHGGQLLNILNLEGLLSSLELTE
jgi:chemotaxis signal transduction protein